MIACKGCRTTGYKNGTLEYRRHADDFCDQCEAVGYIGLDAEAACPSLPSTPLKIAFLAARYRQGMPLFNPLDKADKV